MTENNGQSRSEGESIALTLDLPHPPAKVWRALTDPDLVAQWLLPISDARLEEGAGFTFKAPPQPGWDGVVRCRFLEIEAPRRLSYAWVVGNIDTVVSFTLTPTETGTQLSLVQSGFRPDQKQAFGGARYGWTMMTERLGDVLERVA